MLRLHVTVFNRLRSQFPTQQIRVNIGTDIISATFQRMILGSCSTVTCLSMVMYIFCYCNVFKKDWCASLIYRNSMSEKASFIFHEAVIQLFTRWRRDSYSENSRSLQHLSLKNEPPFPSRKLKSIHLLW